MFNNDYSPITERRERHSRYNEDNSLPFFSDTNVIMQMLKETLKEGLLKVKQNELIAFYSTHKSDKERTDYIESIFNDEYTELLIGSEHDKRVGYKTYENVLLLWDGSFLSRTAQGFYYWGVIAAYYGTMVLLDLFDDIPKQNSNQYSLFESTENKSETPKIPPQAIDYILCNGSGVEHGKFRIYKFYQGHHTAQDNAAFLKHEYGIGGCGPIIPGTNIDEDHDSKGIKIIAGDRFNPLAEVTLSWSKVQLRIGELISEDSYLTQEEKDYLPTYEQTTSNNDYSAANDSYDNEDDDEDEYNDDELLKKESIKNVVEKPNEVIINCFNTCLPKTRKARKKQIAGQISLF